MKTYYHVTLMENLESIMKTGLIPQIGERSVEFGEKEEAIYLFPTEDDMHCALGQWLGEWYDEEYGEDIELAALEITLPNEFPVEAGEVEYECLSKSLIPSEYIKFLSQQ